MNETVRGVLREHLLESDDVALTQDELRILSYFDSKLGGEFKKVRNKWVYKRLSKMDVEFFHDYVKDAKKSDKFGEVEKKLSTPAGKSLLAKLSKVK
jgi:hypothetical protein